MASFAEPLPGTPQNPLERDTRDTGPLAGLEKLHLIMGTQCNTHCVMCYQTDFSERANMPAELYRERLLGAYPHVRVVKMQGGEPTVMSNCRELATLLRTLPGVRISLSTNGIGIDPFWHDALLQRGEQVDVSVNAASEPVYRRVVRRGNYKRVLQNVAALARERSGPLPRLALSLVVLKENFPELHEFVYLARSLGVDAVKFAVDPILSFAGLPSREEVLAELERVDRARQHAGLPAVGLDAFRRRFDGGTEPPPPAARCREPSRNLVVDASGDVRACVMTWMPLGNLYQSSIEEIWNGEPARRLRGLIECGDYSMCEPWCPDNRRPSRRALLHKYASYLGRDPAFFVRKLQRKVQQLRRESA